jgi:hypothetical protein
MVRFELVQIDSRDVTKKASVEVEKTLNTMSDKLEKNGFVVTGEFVAPESTGVKNYFLFAYEKGNPMGIQYKFLVFDVREGPKTANAELNGEIVKLEKEGRDILRYYFMPMKNSAFTQILLVHIPKKKVKEAM